MEGEGRGGIEKKVCSESIIGFRTLEQGHPHFQGKAKDTRKKKDDTHPSQGKKKKDKS